MIVLPGEYARVFRTTTTLFSDSSMQYFNRVTCYLGFFFLTAMSAPSLAQDNLFNFNGSLGDNLAQFEAGAYVQVPSETLLNTSSVYQEHTFEPVFTTEGADTFISLGREQYIGLPPELSQAFDAEQTSQIDLRFRFQDLETEQEDGYFRNILGSTFGDQRDLGFQVWIQRRFDRYNLVIHIGDDQHGGYIYTLDVLSLDVWNELSLIFRLGDAKPRIDAIINNKPFTLWLSDPETLDVSLLIKHLNGGEGKFAGSNSTVALFAGGFYFDRHPLVNLPLDIDSLRVQSPKQPADNATLRQIINDFTGHVLGNQTFIDAELQLRLGNFLSGFGDDLDQIKTDALTFLSAYESVNEPLFSANGQINPGELPPASILAYFLQEWIFDNLFTLDNVSGVAGLKFEAADAYPGIVDPTAPRVMADIQIDGSYSTNPGFLLNGQETVIRPTGYYAAPGESITIKLDPSAVNAGLKVRIGIHRFDLSETWTVYNRFPRISNIFPLTAESTLIANPFGGGIYIEVPDGTDLGLIDVGINGAVKMPMYSTLPLTGHGQDKAEFAAEVAKWPVQWFELHSPNLSVTLPMSVANLYIDPEPMLTHWNAAFDQINRMAGRPLARFRSEWYVPDRQVPVFGTAIPASYPIYPPMSLAPPGEVWASDLGSYSLLIPLQADFTKAGAEYAGRRDRLRILWHEWGHLVNLPTLGFQEQESNVNILAAIVYNQLLGIDLETAMRYSGFQLYGWDESALDVMLSPNWQKGQRLSFDGWDNEVRYQTRSWARLMEIVQLYDWDALGAIHQAFYQRGLDDNTIYNYGLADDDFIETASQVLGVNLGPLFDFWGVPPSAELYARLRDFPLPAGFRDRIAYYRTLVPADNEAFIPVHGVLSATTGAPPRWDHWLAEYDTGTAVVINERLDSIECRYYGCALPIADAGDDRVVDGTSEVDVQLDGTGSTDDYGIFSYHWRCGNDTELTGVTPQLLGLNTSTNCTLTVVDYAGLESQDQVMITKNSPNVAPLANAGADKFLTYLSGESGADFTLSGTDSYPDGTVVTRQWLENGNQIAAASEIQLNRSEGIYTFEYRVTNDENASASDFITVNVYDLGQYNGVIPNSVLGLGVNNIGIAQGDSLYTCIGIFTNDEPVDLDPGVHQYNIKIKVASTSPTFVLRIENTSPFNLNNVLNAAGERPDCSGRLETSTGVYTDVIQVGNDTISSSFILSEQPAGQPPGIYMTLIDAVSL